MNGCHRILISFALLAVLTAPIRPQSRERAAPEEPLKLSAELVVLDAQVLSKKTGAVVNGLASEDFTLLEDGVKQRITHFSQDRLPLSIVLLLDVSGSVQPIIDQVCAEGLRALSQLKPDDEVALMVFGLWTTVLQDFTKNRHLITNRAGDIRSMGHWIGERTYIDEAVFQAAAHLAKASNPDSRRIIIIVTDNLSNQPKNVAHSQWEAMEMLSEAGAVVSGLVVGDFAAEFNRYKSKGRFIEDSIANYVAETGGVALQVDKDDVVSKLAGLIDRIRTRYSFGYAPLNDKPDGKFRKLRLKISREVERREGGIAILTRKGYFSRVRGSTKAVTDVKLPRNPR
ncbi:MAG TPA: VWA domain-containing protein [Blastocatellia bacterium]|nr:VWA domain-containing protein [Blastocatellia bacterium]